MSHCKSEMKLLTAIRCFNAKSLSFVLGFLSLFDLRRGGGTRSLFEGVYML